MKILFIVSWVIATVVPSSCPDAGRITVDEFGRVSKSFGVCTVYHTKIEYSDTLKKAFYNSDSAHIFYKKCLAVGSGYNGGLIAVKIDSLKVKKHK